MPVSAPKPLAFGTVVNLDSVVEFALPEGYTQYTITFGRLYESGTGILRLGTLYR